MRKKISILILLFAAVLGQRWLSGANDRNSVQSDTPVEIKNLGKRSRREILSKKIPVKREVATAASREQQPKSPSVLLLEQGEMRARRIRARGLSLSVIEVAQLKSFKNDENYTLIKKLIAVSAQNYPNLVAGAKAKLGGYLLVDSSQVSDQFFTVYQNNDTGRIALLDYAAKLKGANARIVAQEVSSQFQTEEINFIEELDLIFIKVKDLQQIKKIQLWLNQRHPGHEIMPQWIETLRGEP